jgi:beta-glucanase (GH16 family)
MNRNTEQAFSPLENASKKNERTPRKKMGLSAAALGLSLLALSGCTSDAAPKPETSTTSTPAESATATPTAEAIPPKEVVGLNGEYFLDTPSWQEDFSTSPEGAFRDDSWNIYTGPAEANREAQYYTDRKENLRIEDDTLVIQAHSDSPEGYTSARIYTEGKEDFQYGKFEITAKLPNGVGTWPAVWMLPTEHKYRQQYPEGTFKGYYVDGEMDILEAIGSEQNKVYGIAHSLEDPVNPDYSGGYFNTIEVPDADSAFHTYGLEWTPTNLTFSVDNQVYYTVNKAESSDFKTWPYDQKYHLIVNLALGGNWAGLEKDAFPPEGIDDSKLPTSLQLKSIKYFPYVQK